MLLMLVLSSTSSSGKLVISCNVLGDGYENDISRFGTALFPFLAVRRRAPVAVFRVNCLIMFIMAILFAMPSLSQFVGCSWRCENPFRRFHRAHDGYLMICFSLLLLSGFFIAITILVLHYQQTAFIMLMIISSV